MKFDETKEGLTMTKIREIFFAAVAIALATGCTKTDFRSSKAGVIAKTSVFQANEDGESSGSVDQPRDPGKGPQPSPAPAPSNGTGNDEGHGQVISGGEIPLHRFCSDYISSGGEYAVNTASIRLTVTRNGQMLCQSSDTATLRAMITAGTLRLTILCPGRDLNGEPIESVALLGANNGNLLAHGYGEVIYADNPDIDDGSPLFPDDDPIYQNCDSRQSPLFVDLRTGGGAFELSSPEEGIRFDILGERAKPVAHTPKRIGWFKNAAMAMLVNPDSHGGVHGINQLFGNNTRGPDGDFSPDGFAALAKHDGDGSGEIDGEDDIYKRLSLWIDHDLNGVAGPGELVSLSHLGIESIDLNYDPNFSETDRYGNEVKYKSVVTFANGEMRLIYDLWFLTRN